MKYVSVVGVAFAVATTVAGPARASESGQVFNWTGCYVGLHVGAGYHTSSFVGEDESGGIGAVAGGQTGCNYQVDRLVLGLEGELYWSGLDTQADGSDVFGSDFGKSSNTYDGSLALRLGYAFDRLLAYGKIGVSAGRFEWSGSEQEVGSYAESFTAAQTVLGLLLGIGFEYALAERWSVKLEYNYINFGDPSVSFTESCSGAGCGGIGALSSFTETEKEIKQILQIGFNFKFY